MPCKVFGAGEAHSAFSNHRKAGMAGLQRTREAGRRDYIFIQGFGVFRKMKQKKTHKETLSKH